MQRIKRRFLPSEKSCLGDALSGMRGPTQEATGIGPMMMAHIATRTRTGGDISMMDETTGFTSQYIRVTIVLLTIKHYGLFIYFGLLFVRHTIFPGAIAMALKHQVENPTAGTMTTSLAENQRILLQVL